MWVFVRSSFVHNVQTQDFNFFFLLVSSVWFFACREKKKEDYWVWGMWILKHFKNGISFSSSSFELC